MSAYLSLVVHSSGGYAHVFSSEGLGYRFAQAGLSDSRRAVEAEDRGFHIPFQFQNCKIFNDPVLDAVQSEMVLIQNLLGMHEVEIVF